MAVTVVARYHALPGQAAALVSALRARAGARGSGEPAGLTRVFSGYLDPDLVLSVADRDSRQAYVGEESRRDTDANLAPLCREPIETSFFQLGRSYGVMGRQVGATLCGLIRAPRGAGEATRALWEESAGVHRGAEGFARWYTYADEDDADHFMTISEWVSWSAAQSYLMGPAIEMLPGLLLAEAVIEAFVGVPQGAR